MCRFLLLGLLLLVLPPVRGWGQSYYFNNRYPASSRTQSLLGQPMATDSGFTVCGDIIGPQQSPDMLQVRFLDPDGQTRRIKTFRHPTSSYFGTNRGGLLPVAGGFALAGSRGYLGGSAPMLWRFKANGDTLWTRTYRDSLAGAGGYNVCRTLDGGYVLVGAVVLEQNPGTRTCLWRTDSAGTLLWRRFYGREAEMLTYFVTPTPDGGFLVSGYARTPYNSAYSRIYAYKVDGAGRERWTKQLGDPRYYSTGGPWLVLRDGSYLLTASNGQVKLGSNEYGRQALYHFAPDGTPLGPPRIFGPLRRIPSPYGAVELADGSIVVAGQQGRKDSLRMPDVMAEAYVYKVCAGLDSVWFRTYRKLDSPRSHNYQTGFCRAPDGGFLVTGFVFARPPDSGTSDGWAFRIDSMGYLMAGGAPPARVCPRPTGVGLVPDVGAATAGGRVYPNPSATGVFTLSGAGGAEAVVVDALGRVVRRWRVPPQTEAPLDLGSAPPGLYLLRLTWPDGRTFTTKLLRNQ